MYPPSPSPTNIPYVHPPGPVPPLQVDELKTLLQSTVIDMGLTPENKARKLQAIYDRIRADCAARDLFESDFSASEEATVEMMEQVQRLFSHGPGRIAGEVVAELAQRIQQAIEKEEQDYVCSASDSVGLRAILKQLSLLSDHILNKVETVNEDEIRRSHTTIEAIDVSVRASHIDLPAPILTALTDARSCNADADSLHTHTQHAVNQFRERVPRFVQEMQDGVTGLGRKLFDIMETGNDAMVSKERAHSAQVMGTDFEDLKLAIDLELDALKESTDEARMARELAAAARAELLALIDDVYGMDASAVDGGQLAALMRMLKNGEGDNGYDGGAGSPRASPRADEQDGGGGDIPERSPRADAAPAFQEEVQDYVNVQKAQEEQTEAMNTAALDSALALEQKMQAEKIEALKNSKNTKRDGDDSDDILGAHTAESAALEEKWSRERDQKLEALMRADSSSDPDSLSPAEQRAVGMANSAYAVALRLSAMHARRAFATLQLALQNDLVQLEATHSRSPVDTEEEERLARAVAARVDDQARRVQALQTELVAVRERTQDEENKRRRAWLASPGSLNVGTESARLQQAVAEAMMSIDAEMDETEHTLKTMATTAAATVTEQTEMKIRSFNTPSMDRTLRQSAKNQADSAERRVAHTMTAEKAIVASEKSYLDIILEYTDTWGLGMRDGERQRQLFARASHGMEASFQVQQRLLTMEHELQAEAQEAQLVADLTRKRATAVEIEGEIHNHIESTREKGALRMSALKAEQEGSRGRLKDRQESAVVDYEHEFCVAIEDNSCRAVEQDITICRARTTTLAAVFTALRHKKQTLLSTVEAAHMPENIKSASVEQVDAETFREESELLAAFCAFRGTWGVHGQHTGCMVEGVVANTGTTCHTINHAFESESALLKEAYAMDIRRLRRKHYVIQFGLREAEASRLTNSDRAPEDVEVSLAKLYDIPLLDVVEEVLSGVLTKAAADHQEAQEHLQAAAAERIELERAYDVAVEKVQHSYEAVLDEVSADFGARRTPDDSPERTHVLRRKECVERASARATYEADLVDAYHQCMSKHFTTSKVDDELRTLLQRKQQETEALESALAQEKQKQLETLIDHHKDKRDAAGRKRLENDAALEGLDAVMDRKRATNAAMLQKRRLQRRLARQKELVTAGSSESDAARTAESESAAFEQAESESAEKQMKSMEKRMSEDPLTDALARLKQQHNSTSETLRDGLLANQKTRKSGLAERLAARQRTKARELVVESGGKMTEAQAMQEAQSDLATLDEADTQALDTQLAEDKEHMSKLVAGEIEDEKSRIEKAFKMGALSEADYKGEMDRINANERLSHALLQQGLETTRNKLKHNLKKRREKLKAKYAAGIKEAQPDMDADEVEQVAGDKADEEIARQSGMLEKDLNLAHVRLHELAAANYDETVANIKTEHELRMKGLDAGKKVAMQSRKRTLMSRLQRRKEIVRNSLAAKGKDPAEAEAIVQKTYQEDEENVEAEAEADAERHVTELLASKRAEREGAAEVWAKESRSQIVTEESEVSALKASMDKHEYELYYGEGTAAAQAVAGARKAARDAQDSTDGRLAEIREAHNANAERLKSSMANKKISQEDALRQRLAAKRAVRQKELEAGGVAAPAAEEQVQQEGAQSEEDAIDTLKEALRAELAAEMFELTMATQVEEHQAVADMHNRASNDLSIAEGLKNAAEGRLEQIKKTNEREARRLAEDISASRHSKESKLKERLRLKREAQLKKLEEETASSATRDAAAARLAEEEETALAELRRAEDEDEAARTATLRDEAQRAVEEAAERVRAEDIEASVAAAKVAALSSQREQEASASAEASAEELKRLRDLHDAEEARHNAGLDQDKKKTQGKLGDRYVLDVLPLVMSDTWRGIVVLWSPCPSITVLALHNTPLTHSILPTPSKLQTRGQEGQEGEAARRGGGEGAGGAGRAPRQRGRAEG